MDLPVGIRGREDFPEVHLPFWREGLLGRFLLEGPISLE